MAIFATRGAVMAKSPAIGTKKSLSQHDGDGNQIHNTILLNLSREQCHVLFSKMEFVRLKLQQVMHEAGESIKSGYFCNSGMFSVLTVMPDGKSVEVGLIGKEGFAGSPLVAGFRTSFTRTVAQAESTAFRVDADVLRTAFRQCPALERQIQRYSQILGSQTTQIATCNRLHNVEERLARWLLMTQDRVVTPNLPLTQEFLAEMLGTRRSSVTVAAGALQKAGLISYRRGHVTVLNRSRLEEIVCVCYGLLQKQAKIWGQQDILGSLN
jgi:CRP-like cAMP-binding protein